MILFSIFSAVAVLGALGLIFFRNPVHSALSLLLTFFAMAALYVQLDAPVLAVFQVAVYAGAIMVLFIFVVMFLNLDVELGHHRHEIVRLAVMVGASGVMVAVALWGLSHLRVSGVAPASLDQARGLAELLLTKHVVAFEVISLLLVGTAIGAVALNRKTH